MAKKLGIDLTGMDGTVTAIEGIESERFEEYSGGFEMELDVDAIKKGIWTRVALYLNKKLGSMFEQYKVLVPVIEEIVKGVKRGEAKIVIEIMDTENGIELTMTSGNVSRTINPDDLESIL